jgi:hypothetical protein
VVDTGINGKQPAPWFLYWGSLRHPSKKSTAELYTEGERNKKHNERIFAGEVLATNAHECWR